MATPIRGNDIELVS